MQRLLIDYARERMREREKWDESGGVSDINNIVSICQSLGKVVGGRRGRCGL